MTPPKTSLIGEIITEELEARGWSIDTLAKESMLGRGRVEEIISGNRRITRIVAVGLSRAFDVSEQVWLNLQKQVDAKVRQNDNPKTQNPHRPHYGPDRV